MPSTISLVIGTTSSLIPSSGPTPARCCVPDQSTDCDLPDMALVLSAILVCSRVDIANWCDPLDHSLGISSESYQLSFEISYDVKSTTNNSPLAGFTIPAASPSGQPLATSGSHSPCGHKDRCGASSTVQNSPTMSMLKLTVGSAIRRLLRTLPTPQDFNGAVTKNSKSSAGYTVRMNRNTIPLRS